MATDLSNVFNVYTSFNMRNGEKPFRVLDMDVMFNEAMRSYTATLGQSRMAIDMRALQVGAVTWEAVRERLHANEMKRMRDSYPMMTMDMGMGSSYSSYNTYITDGEVCTPNQANKKSEDKKIRRTLCSEHLWS